MLCKNCGGRLPEGAKICGFCGTEAGEAGEEGQGRPGRGETPDLEKRLEEILVQAGCGGCEQETDAQPDRPGVKKAHWWKEGDCGSCGGGLTGPDKDMKYALTIVGLAVAVIAIAFLAKIFL